MPHAMTQDGVKLYCEEAGNPAPILSSPRWSRSDGANPSPDCP
jgi:hypothetical protein